MRGGGGVHVGAYEGAVCRGAARGRAEFDAVDEKEMVEPLDSVRMELCKDAGCVESYYGNEFVRRVSAEGE
jgi:hypothetical protein